MKARTIALLWVIAGAMVMAQTAPPSQKVAPESKPAAANTAATQTKPAAVAKPAAAPAKPVAAVAKPAAGSPMQPKPAAKAAAKPLAKPEAKTPAKAPAKAQANRAPKPASKPAAAEVKQAAIRTTTPASSMAGKRDPFLSPVREQGATGPACMTGKKCLAISTIVLRGIVKSQSGMIAVVESSTRRISYFLRETDPVFNGYVVKITSDTVVFRENVMDRLGRTSTRDVVMKVVAPVV